MDLVVIYYREDELEYSMLLLNYGVRRRLWLIHSTLLSDFRQSNHSQRHIILPVHSDLGGQEWIVLFRSSST